MAIWKLFTVNEIIEQIAQEEICSTGHKKRFGLETKKN